MKGYTIPSMLLLAVVGLFVLGALYTLNLSRDASEKLAGASLIKNGYELQLQAATQRSHQADADAIPVEKFIDQWKDQFNAGDDLSQIFGRLDTLAVDNFLSSSEKDNHANPGYLFSNNPRNVLGITIKVSGGDYSRIINWLGQIETTYPLSRAEEVSFTANNNTISMHTVLTFPRFFSEDKKK